MPPKHKQQLDKAAWSWTETVDHTQITDEHIHMAYRLNLSSCERGTCKRNCKGNPFCLNNLGEKKWFGQVDESKLQNFNPDYERRQEGNFVGLKNLGATCYVNTFLQLWFHNPIVRQAIYEWRSLAMEEHYVDGWKPSSICEHLQVIFALMQSSKRCYVDPTPLIDCLGLDAGEQQDAQEFSKLFLQALENALSNDSHGKQNVIDQQFCGRYCYVTVCQNCGSQSETPATFYELDLNIRGHTSLTASIKDFLQKEKLEGDNQYMCIKCNSKQNATRAIELKKLPPVLNLQLLRFVFDKNKGHKKKLSSFIQFPETLDMRPYLGDMDGMALYDLVAVLIHSGPTANSGHYIAHIREHKSGVWYKFNDEEIEKMKKWKLELGKEDDVMASPSSEANTEKAPKASKGVHSSRNAYMLVYTLREQSPKGEDSSAETPVLETLLPATVRGYVDKDNFDFEKWIEQMLEDQKNNISKTKEEYEGMKAIYNALPVTTLDDSWEWVSNDWLATWLSKPDKMEKCVNRVPRCPHGKMPPDEVIKMKCISAHGAALLFAKFPIDKRFKGPSLLCERCIRRQCREMRFRRCMTEDDRLFSIAKNTKINIYTLSEDISKEYFWVSTKHLRSWKRFAVQTISVEESSSSIPPFSSSPSSLSPSSIQSSLSLCNTSTSPTVASLHISSTHYSQSMDTNCCENGNAVEIQNDSKHRSESASTLQVSSSSSIYSTSSSSPSTHLSKSAIQSAVLVQSRAKINSLSQVIQCVPDSTTSGLHNDHCQNSIPCEDSCSKLSNSGKCQNNTFRQHTVVDRKSEHQNNDCEVKTETCENMNCVCERSSLDNSSAMEVCDDSLNDMFEDKHSFSCEKNNGSSSCNGLRSSRGDKADQDKEEEKDNEDDDEDMNEIFNDDIVCIHGNLRIDQTGRRLIKKEVWERLLYYFPHLTPFTSDSPNCEICLASQQQELDLKRSRKLAGQGQKDLLQDLYHSRNRPKIQDVWQKRNAFIVSTNFVEGWRKFVKHSIKQDPVLEIVNTPLLCEHGLLLYKLEDMNMLDSTTRFTLVWEEEWRILTTYFKYDVEIQVTQYIEQELGRVAFQTVPDVCSTCLHERIRQEEEGKFVFTAQTIYVRKMVDGSNFEAVPRGDDLKGNGKSKGYNYDPEFSAPKHDKLYTQPPEKLVKLDTAVSRKSSRHRKTRGEKEVVVSSSMTLKELKIKLFSLFHVPPYDQNLSLDGRILMGDDSSLQDFRFYPQCVIFLKADEPNADSSAVHDDFLNVQNRPEEGFKGTNLLGL